MIDDGLSEVLFTKVQRRVLGVLFGSPDRSFYANEIVRLADSGVGAVDRELKRLAAAGLLTVQRVGNQKHFQANQEAPIFEELRGIVVKTFGLGDVLRLALQPLADRIVCAFIYGSLAKGGDTAQSDVDLMLVGDGLAYPDIYPALIDAEGRLGRKISPTVYGPAELRRKLSEGNAFLTRVLAQPKIFLVGTEHDLPEPAQSGEDR